MIVYIHTLKMFEWLGTDMATLSGTTLAKGLTDEICQFIRRLFDITLLMLTLVWVETSNNGQIPCVSPLACVVPESVVMCTCTNDFIDHFSSGTTLPTSITL